MNEEIIKIIVEDLFREHQIIKKCLLNIGILFKNQPDINLISKIFRLLSGIFEFHKIKENKLAERHNFREKEVKEIFKKLFNDQHNLINQNLKDCSTLIELAKNGEKTALQALKDKTDNMKNIIENHIKEEENVLYPLMIKIGSLSNDMVNYFNEINNSSDYKNLTEEINKLKI